MYTYIYLCLYIIIYIFIFIFAKYLISKFNFKGNELWCFWRHFTRRYFLTFIPGWHWKLLQSHSCIATKKIEMNYIWVSDKRVPIIRYFISWKNRTPFVILKHCIFLCQFWDKCIVIIELCFIEYPKREQPLVFSTYRFNCVLM